MSTPHTPRPWYVSGGKITQPQIASEATGATVAIVFNAADAPILAAAPEMLRELQTVATWLISPSLDADTLREMRGNVLAVLASATGTEVTP